MRFLLPLVPTVHLSQTILEWKWACCTSGHVRHACMPHPASLTQVFARTWTNATISYTNHILEDRGLEFHVAAYAQAHDRFYQPKERVLVGAGACSPCAFRANAWADPTSNCNFTSPICNQPPDGRHHTVPLTSTSTPGCHHLPHDRRGLGSGGSLALICQIIASGSLMQQLPAIYCGQLMGAACKLTAHSQPLATSFGFPTPPHI